MSRPILRGISWNHSRALPPLVAAAQRFEEMHPEVTILWEKRTLHEFGHTSLADLCHRFDLLVVDHPMMGEAHTKNLLRNLHPELSSEEWNDLLDDSVGASFTSYVMEENLYALPIDAAAPAASFRDDLLAKADVSEPTTWSEMLSLAHRGLVRMPGFPADLFLNFMGLCASRGAKIAINAGALVDRSLAFQCLDELRELAALMPHEIYQWNPIVLYERMAATDDFAYCPFAYTYSNYSRPGFAKNVLTFGSSPTLTGGETMRSVLGGTGLAVSRASKCPELSLSYSRYVAGRTCQSTLYPLAGGQPSRRSAWCDTTVNNISGDFFQRTQRSIETAYVRPRYDGYVSFQEKAGIPLAAYLRDGGNAEHTIDRIDALYRASLQGVKHA